jgi:long-chain fatty acid transport protein
MKCSKKYLKSVSMAAIVLFAAASAHAAAFDLPDQDAFVIGRGMAFVATADNPSAIYYNPAGISQLAGNNLRAGIYGIDLEPSYKNPNTGQTFDNQFKYHAIPQFFYTYGRTNWPVSFGLGSYSPFGLAEIWPQNTGFAPVATEGRIFTETLNPVIAFKLSPVLSIGGGVTVNYAKLNLQNTQFQFHGDGWDVGYNLGVLWQPVEKISIGATFRSASTMEYHGTTSVSGLGSSPSYSQWPFPLKAIFGISYRPTPKWNLEFDADYTDWSALGTVSVHQTSLPLSYFVPTISDPLNWQSSWYYEWGVTRYFDNGWHISGGYIFNQNSVPDANYSPLVADLDRHFVSVGVGHKGRKFDFDIAYQFGYGPTRTVSSSGGPQNGDYSYISHAIAVSGEWHF